MTWFAPTSWHSSRPNHACNRRLPLFFSVSVTYATRYENSGVGSGRTCGSGSSLFAYDYEKYSYDLNGIVIYNPKKGIDILYIIYYLCGPGRSVGIATGYRLDGPRIESRWGVIFRTCSGWPWGPPSPPCIMGTGSFQGVESGRGVTLTHHPLLVPSSKKQSRAITLLSLRAFMAC
jgi:hypothetical protein